LAANAITRSAREDEPSLRNSESIFVDREAARAFDIEERKGNFFKPLCPPCGREINLPPPSTFATSASILTRLSYPTSARADFRRCEPADRVEREKGQAGRGRCPTGLAQFPQRATECRHGVDGRKEGRAAWLRCSARQRESQLISIDPDDGSSQWPPRRRGAWRHDASATYAPRRGL